MYKAINFKKSFFLIIKLQSQTPSIPGIGNSKNTPQVSRLSTVSHRTATPVPPSGGLKVTSTEAATPTTNATTDKKGNNVPTLTVCQQS